jgi:hypothetical protein
MGLARLWHGARSDVGMVGDGLDLYDYFLIRWFVGMTKTTQPEESALDILKKRYASGQIDKEEFEQKKKDLL